MKKILKYKNYILFFLLFILYFSFSMIVCYDTAHYVGMSHIFDGSIPWQNWDIVRGWFFPYLIYLSNTFFGKTSQGLLILTFIFYLVMLTFVNKLAKKAFPSNRKLDRIFRFLTLIITIFNPIVFGYYHTLLTEFVAITFSVTFTYLAWRWMDIDDVKSKKNIIYTIIFAIFTAISWSLKQPYVSTVLFPVVIAAFMSIINKFKLKNVIQRSTTIITCIIVMIISISLWNNFLSSKNINTSTDRSSGNVLGNQLVMAIDNFEIVKDETKYEKEAIKNNKYLSSSEKNKLIKNKNYKIINIYSSEHKIITQDLVLTDNGLISSSNGLKFIANEFFTRPLLISEAYFSNYFAIINMYKTYTPDGVLWCVERDLDLGYVNENSTIAYRTFSNVSNVFYMPDAMNILVSDYEQFGNVPKLQQYMMYSLTKPSNYTFKLSLLIIPIILLISFILSFTMKNYKKLLNLVVILSGYSFLHVMAHSVTGARIDRYASPAYLTSLIAIVILGYVLINNCLEIRKYKNK